MAASAGYCWQHGLQHAGGARGFSDQARHGIWRLGCHSGRIRARDGSCGKARQELVVQVRNRGAVVAGDVEPLAAQGYRTVDDVLARPVIVFNLVLPERAAVILERQQVEIGCGEDAHRVAQVAGNGKRLEEYFRADHGGAEIAEDSPLQFADRGGENLEILPAAPADGAKIGQGMLVDDICADGNVHGIGDAAAIRGVNQAQVAMDKAVAGSHPGPHGFADAQALARPGLDGQVELAARFFCHAKRAVFEAFGHILAGGSLKGDLEIVDHGGPVAGQVGDHAPLDQIDQDRETGRA